MRRFAFISCLAMGSTLAHAASSPSQMTIVWAGRLLAEAGKPVEAGRSIVIEGARIERIVPGFVTLEGAQVVDLRAQTVLPGLIDCHVHLSIEQPGAKPIDAMRKSDVDVAFDGAASAKRTLEAGFTTVADLGGNAAAIFGLRDAIARGAIPGPHIIAAGRALTPTGGHDDLHGYRAEIMAAMSRDNTCDGADDCRREVREWVQRGAQVIKITATGGVLSDVESGLDQQFSQDELQAIVETAHALNRPVYAHAHGKKGIEASLRAGVDSIEHGFLADAATFQLLRRSGAYLVPTLLAGATIAEEAERPDTWMTPAVRQKARDMGRRALDMLRNAHLAGVKIAFGTDSGVSRHGENGRELELMVAAGFTPAEALRAATVDAAAHLGIADSVGTLSAGRQADLIAVEGNPLSHIETLREVSFVMRAGSIYKNYTRN